MLVCNHRRKLSEGVLYLTVCRGKQDRIKINEDEEAEALDFMNLRVDILQRGNVTVRISVQQLYNYQTYNINVDLYYLNLNCFPTSNLFFLEQLTNRSCTLTYVGGDGFTSHLYQGFENPYSNFQIFKIASDPMSDKKNKTSKVERMITQIPIVGGCH